MTDSPHTITIDGSAGEGGGQVLRTALSMSLVTGRPFVIENIRANRRQPGLKRQHLTSVRAAAEVGRAQIEGAELGSRRLAFTPGQVEPGEYNFNVGSAGSATLVLQTVLPPLVVAEGPSHLTLEGGTHNPWAPPLDFLEKAFLPILARMGPQVTVTLRQHGFYPAGGGSFEVEIRPAGPLEPIELSERGRVVRRQVTALVSRLPVSIAEREVKTAGRKLDWDKRCQAARQVDSAGPGNVVMVEIESERVTEVFTGFGQKGVPAERVAAGVARETRRYLDARVPVGEHLADQLLIPLALAGAGSFRTMRPSQHTRTNVEVICRFLDVAVGIEQVGFDAWEVRVGR
jgi:RNA 3'-terminal phosphate cyclase (ATP)